MKVLIINNYDSFVYNIVQAVQKAGAKVDVVENDQLSGIEELEEYSAAIISPGPGNPVNPEDRGEIFNFIDRFRNGKILGICFGHQVLAYYLGSSIKRSSSVKHGEIDMISHNGGELYKGVPENFNSTRYHSLEIEPSVNVIVDSTSHSDGAVMGFHSRRGRMYGIQFHPESYYSEYGENILQNFLVI